MVAVMSLARGVLVITELLATALITDVLHPERDLVLVRRRQVYTELHLGPPFSERAAVHPDRVYPDDVNVARHRRRFLVPVPELQSAMWA